MIKNYEILDRELLGKNVFVRLVKAFVILAVLLRNLLLKLVLFLLSYIIPKSKRILFFSSVGNYNFPLWRNEEDFQFKESPKYLAIYSAKKLKDFITVFHVPNRKLFREIEKLGIKPTKGLRAFWSMLRAKYLFVDNNNFFNPNASFLMGCFKLVQCWHGTPLKNMREDEKHKLGWLGRVKNKEYSKFHYVLTTCGHSTQVYKKLFDTERILEIGYPKNDILFHPEFFSCEQIDRKLTLKNYEKVFLYAPTFRKKNRAVNPFGQQFLSRLNEVLKDRNYILLIKQHPYSKTVEGLEKFSNINDVSGLNNDIQELLVHIDVLISDYSSTVFDFALTERLQLFYPFDVEEYKNKQGDFYFKYSEENLPGLIIANQDDFIEKIKQIEMLIEDKGVKNRIKEFKNRFNRYTDGDSCRRVFQCLKLTEEEI